MNAQTFAKALKYLGIFLWMLGTSILVFHFLKTWFKL